MFSARGRESAFLLPIGQITAKIPSSGSFWQKNIIFSKIMKKHFLGAGECWKVQNFMFLQKLRKSYKFHGVSDFSADSLALAVEVACPLLTPEAQQKITTLFNFSISLIFN